MEITRRKYLAVTAILGISGCASPEENTMTQEDARKEFDDVQTFEGGPVPANNAAARMVDEEAGIVLYAMAGGQGVGLSAVPKEDTDL